MPICQLPTVPMAERYVLDYSKVSGRFMLNC
jgi:hypothetical protein